MFIIYPKIHNLQDKKTVDKYHIVYNNWTLKQKGKATMATELPKRTELKFELFSGGMQRFHCLQLFPQG